MVLQRLAALLLLQMVCLTAKAENLTQKVRKDPNSSYFFIKNHLKSNPRVQALLPDYEDNASRERWALGTCADPTLAIGKINRIEINNITSIAFEILFMETTLVISGYPNKIWKSKVIDYEKKSVLNAIITKDLIDNRSGNKFTKALANDLKRYRSSHSRKLPIIHSGADECGDGEVDVEIQTQPKAKKIQYINKIYFDLCKSQNINPLDSLTCDQYTDYASEKDGVYMAGRYKILVTWDGPTRVFDMNVDDLTQVKNGRRLYSVQRY